MSKNRSRYLTLAIIFGPVFALTYSLHVEDKPFFATSIAGSSLIHMWMRPEQRERLLTAAIGLRILAAYALVWPAARRSFTATAACLGMGNLAVTGVRAVWREGPARKAQLRLFLPAIVMAVSSIIGALALLLASYFHPKTYDLFLYSLDSTLRFRPSFLMGRLFAASKPLALAAGPVYAVPFTAALQAGFTATIPMRQAERWQPILAGGLTIGLWLIAVRTSVAVFQKSAILPWGAPLCTIVPFVLLDKRLANRSQDRGLKAYHTAATP